jgi:serine/threonine protein kinase
MALPTKEEISIAIESGHSINAVELSGYEPVPGIIGPESYSGGFCVVFPFVKGRQRKAVRVWHQEIDKIKERYRLLSQDFKRLKNNALLSFEYVEKGLNVKGQLLDITIMDWVEGYPLKNYILDIVHDTRSKKEKSQAILELAGKLRDAFENMHKLGLSHGDLQHDNIIITGDGAPRFIDYDCFYSPSMGSRFHQTTAGYHGYQHPSRFKRSYISNEKSDYFSELVIYTCLIAIAEEPSLVDRYNISESEWMLFSGEDLNNFLDSKVYKDLSKLSEDVQKCLTIISNYLSKGDINDLEPFVNFLDESVLKEKTKQAFLRAQEIGTRKAYQDFVDSCSVFSYASYYRNKARKRLSEIDEDVLWKSATRANTPSSYREYISKTILKLHVSEAKEKHEELLWAMAQSHNDEHSYKNYLLSSYLHKYSFEAERRLDDVLWNLAVSKNTLEAFREYKSKSKSPRKELNKKLAEFNEQYWNEAQRKDTIAAYDHFLSNFYLGTNASAARARRDQLRKEEADHTLWRSILASDTIEGYKKYIATSVLQLHRKDAEDRINKLDNKEWEEVCRVNSIGKYNDYLRKFPSGLHVVEAKDKIRRLEAKESFKTGAKILLAILVVLSIVIIGIESNGGQTKENKSDKVEQPVRKPVPENIPQSNLSQIANALEKKLNAMETAKKVGDSINPTMLKEAEDLLKKLTSHSNYYKYKQRLNALK